MASSLSFALHPRAFGVRINHGLDIVEDVPFLSLVVEGNGAELQWWKDGFNVNFEVAN